VLLGTSLAPIEKIGLSPNVDLVIGLLRAVADATLRGD
jgi:hypothetical protein